MAKKTESDLPRDWGPFLERLRDELEQYLAENDMTVMAFSFASKISAGNLSKFLRKDRAVGVTTAERILAAMGRRLEISS